MAQAVEAFERFFLNRLFEVDELARAPANLDFAVVHDGHTGGVVAAIFQPAQPIEDDGHDRLGSDVANYPAHLLTLFPLRHPTVLVLLAAAADG
jgi:hypothetical protein